MTSSPNSRFSLELELSDDDDTNAQAALSRFQRFRQHVDAVEDDDDTASARSIALSSPAPSPRHSLAPSLAASGLPSTHDAVKRDSATYAIDTMDTAHTSGTDREGSLDTDEINLHDSPISSVAPSVHEVSNPVPLSPIYPPKPVQASRASTFSTASESSYSKKARPESMLPEPKGPLVLGIALVDFNHIVGPKIEFSQGDIFDDEEVAKILPFLALPDGAHLSTEDYSYFHLVPTSPNPTTIFGISCNRQISASELLVKDVDVTRSTVQKAVVILASTPIFGLIRDRLGVITRALFDQRDFTEKGILVDFYESLELGLKSQLTESGLYMGTSLRELVHTFRQRTLILIKALILQKRIMFSGHPVERLCTYQYSLISLIPGLLQSLDDCGSPPLTTRASTLTRPSTLKTSDRKSMMAYTGLPLDIFGKDAFFQPYLPLQQLDIMKETRSWLCGSTNSIVTQSKEIDLLVNLETGLFEFRNPTVERSAGLTPADRKWMDEIVQDVNEGWNDKDPSRPTGMQFKGSDDYLRTKFDEYISAALASVKFADFVAKGEAQGVVISGTGGDANSTLDFNPVWIAEFRRTDAYEVWNRITDPVLFDIVEPRHPCGEKPSVVSDIGLRLAEGIQELKLDQQLAPAREAVTNVLTTGSTNFLRAVDGVRGRWQRRSQTATTLEEASVSGSSTPVEISRSEAELAPVGAAQRAASPPLNAQSSATPAQPLSVTAAQAATDTKAALSTWGTGIGTFLSSRWSSSRNSTPVPSPGSSPAIAPTVPVGYVAPANELATAPPSAGRDERTQLKSFNLDGGRGRRSGDE